MLSSSEFIKENFNVTNAFKKEIFIFNNLMPTCIEIQKEAGFEDFDFVDLSYWCRLSFNSESKIADEDVIILMENLKVNGYFTMDRKQDKI